MQTAKTVCLDIAKSVFQGGLNSRISNWQNAIINAMDEFKNDFRCITMDQRNATNGESTGPIPFDAFADDQLGLLDHLGIRQFVFFGNCIGGSFALKLMERAPERVVAAVLSQPIGHRSEKYLHNLYRARPDFVYSVSREFVRNCQTPMLVLPDDTAAHAYQVAIDVASLAPKADISVYPWKDPPELKARTNTRVRTFQARTKGYFRLDKIASHISSFVQMLGVPKAASSNTRPAS
jgi:pimeloyl-ACP methyl ester carboxylesterase